MNKNIKVIQTRKYKDINLYLRFSMENKTNARQCIALLSKLIGDTSRKYPSKLEMTRIKDFLYGISVDTSYKNRSNLLTFTIHYTFINPRFVDISIDEYNSFIKEILYNSLINDKTVAEAKSIISDSIRRRNDKPANKSYERVIEIVSEDNSNFNMYSCGDKFIEELNKITTNELIDFYQFILNKAQLNIYLCGDLKSEDVDKLCDYNFDNRIPTNININIQEYKEKQMIIDKQDISQSYLTIMYSSPYSKKDKDFFAWYMANNILGYAPTSLLFNEIREKESLCYSISSINFKFDGLLKISTSIDGKNKDIVIKEIKKQVDRLINKDYDLNILEKTKTYVINSLMGIYDDIDSLIEYYTECELIGFNYSIEEYCDKLSKINADDISNIFKNHHHYFDFILLGTKDE